MEVKLLSGALGAEIKGIDLKDTSDQNFKKINDLLLEHKVIFFRDQKITEEEHMALAEKFGPLETHAYVKGLDKYPEIVRIIKAEDEKNQWGEDWHSDVSYNVKPTKAVIIKSIKIPPVGGDTCFSNMELAWETLDEKIKKKIKFIKGDIRNKELLNRALKNTDAVIHLAYVNGTGNFYREPVKVLDIAVKGILNVLDGCIKNNIKDGVDNIAKLSNCDCKDDLDFAEASSDSFTSGVIVTQQKKELKLD